VKPTLRHRVAAISMAASLVSGVGLLAACGGGESEPLIAPSMTTVGELSAESAEQPIIKDVNAVRAATTSGESDEAVEGVYDLLNRAGAEQDVAEGAALIRAELPAIVARFEADYPSVRARLVGVRPRTRPGREMRAMALDILDTWHRELPAFKKDVSTSSLTWGAVLRFGERNNAFSQQQGVRLDRMFRSLTSSERDVLTQALREVFGSQAFVPR
jgi:hypothetical protein